MQFYALTAHAKTCMSEQTKRKPRWRRRLTMGWWRRTRTGCMRRDFMDIAVVTAPDATHHCSL